MYLAKFLDTSRQNRVFRAHLTGFQHRANAKTSYVSHEDIKSCVCRRKDRARLNALLPMPPTNVKAASHLEAFRRASERGGRAGKSGGEGGTFGEKPPQVETV